MSITNINFEDLIQDNKLFDKPMHLNIIPDNIPWFGNTIFSNHFILNNNGIHFGNYSQITTLTSENKNTQTFTLNFHVVATPYNIESLQFKNCIFDQEPIIQNEAIKSIEFYDCQFKGDIHNLLKKYRGLSLKINFDKIENKIEANKYHALELEKLILQLHWLTSRNATNWWIPLLLIFLVGFVTYVRIHWQEYFSYYPQTKTRRIEESFLGTFKHIYILYKYKDLWNTHPILLAFNKFSLGYLYYQFLISVRKDTRK